MGTTISVESFPYLEGQDNGGKTYAPEQAARVMKGCQLFLRDAGIAGSVALIKVIPGLWSGLGYKAYVYDIYLVISKGGTKFQTEKKRVEEKVGDPDATVSIIAQALLEIAQDAFRRKISDLESELDSWTRGKPVPLYI